MAHGTWHMACQTYALNLFQYHRSQNQTPFLFLSPRSRCLSFLSKLPDLFRLPRLLLFFASLLLLSYSQSSQALTAQTTRVIEGGAPYFTFDGGRTRVTSRDDFVAITLPDGTRITPSTNTSSATNPIILPAGSTLGDIGMLVPQGYISRDLSDLVALGNWGDDDGDGQSTNGVTATGRISVGFSDKDGRSVSRNDTLNPCKAPYRVRLDVTHSSLTTQYGVPNSSTLSSQQVTYYIKPDSTGGCYFVQSVRPNLTRGTDNKISPSNIWDPNKGFLTQSTSPSSYDQNFPKTDADGLYFDLEMPAGVNAGQLTWSVVTNGDITATVTSVAANDRWIPSVDRGKVVARVKLSGPRASGAQINSDNPSPLDVPDLPQTFELVGRDSRGNEVRYGFVLKQWFVHSGGRDAGFNYHSSWCGRLGYRVPDMVGIKSFLHVWGGVNMYSNANFPNRCFWSSTPVSDREHYAFTSSGRLLFALNTNGCNVACATPY
ncbi:hypothetical protein [Gilliamella sp. ESL0254]|uniref:hypothetical protein n=1 Tax=Gilliamella sp. ESL0254 TaxID=2705035 RepID=UPI001580EEE8|nr:hypothetical protein [Gilliamella sp. ESL0254]NUF28380.1 hypothetical protein [Gilliamella sp. ESL0254]